MQTSQQLIGAMRPMAPLSSVSQPAAVINRGPPQPVNEPPKKNNDLLDFDVFSEFRSPTLMTSQKPKEPAAGLDKTDGANQSTIDFMLDISSNDSPSLLSSSTNITSTSQTKNSNMDDLSGLIDVSPQVTPEPPKPVIPAPAPSPVPAPTPALSPPSHAAPSPMSQENYAVPLETLRPGE